MKKFISITAALIVLTGGTYATVHTKRTQARTEPVSQAAASVGGLSAVDDTKQEIQTLRASRNRLRPTAGASVTTATPTQVRHRHRVRPAAVRTLATRRAASAPSAGTWYRLVQCEASGHWDYGKPGHYIDRGYNFEGGPNFTHSTWLAYGGRQFAEHAYDATPSQQIVVAERVLRGQGPGAWPHCSYVAGMR